MTNRKALFALSLSALALSACAPQVDRLASSPPPRPHPDVDWAFQASDVPVDPAWTFGKLDNGLRFAIRRNATPQGTALVRLVVDAGSLDESDGERGYAHFVEHMAFNGSTHVPEGEMVRLLEREGLAFGAHTNAQTNFEYTMYQLDLPRNQPALLDTALMLMRETASELSFAPDAVTRERGVVLAEMRDRNTFAWRNLTDQLDFITPQARYVQRLPIGTTEALNAASAEALRAFWAREYVPGHTTLAVIGDFDPALVEAAIRAKFSDWRTAPAATQPDAGPVAPADHGRSDVFIDPALSERITASRHGPYLDEADSVDQRRENLLRQIGYAIVNRRLIRLTRQVDPPFRSAGLGTGDVFRVGRTTNLVVDTVDGRWRRGLISAGTEYHRALAQGFSDAEVAEQLAIIRTAARNDATAADTRSNAALFGALFALIESDVTPATPESSLQRLEAFVPQITPARVHAALLREVVALDDPLLRFQGRRDPEGGAPAIRAAWERALRAPLGRPQPRPALHFGYTGFGTPGTVAADSVAPALGIRTVRFANGVRLNLKHTDLEHGRVLVQVSIDGGEMLDTRAAPLTTEMTGQLTLGGLGQHSADDLQTLLAGRAVSPSFSATPETFVMAAQTTPEDLALQLQLFAATTTDPGYRREGEVVYRQSINNFFASLRATPGSALAGAIGGILSDNDPRFTLQAVDAYRGLTFAQLRTALADRLAHGAIELGVVGDFDEAQVIALVGQTFGALPPREADFRPYAEQRQRPFTADRSVRQVRHTGAADQAIVRLTWPTRDGEDPLAEQELELLQRVVQIAVTDSLRERLGQAYSPGATSDASRFWRGYGTFTVSASVEAAQADAARAAIAETIAALRDAPISADMLLRARAPMLDGIDNALKTNRGWLALVDRAQSEPDRIDRYQQARTRLSAITAERLQALTRQYLTADGAVPVVVLPEGAAGGR
jgi:zinc protease